MREQPLDPSDDRTDIGDLSLQVLPRDIRFSGPRLRDEARAAANTKDCDGIRTGQPFDQLAFQKPIASGPYLIEQYDNGRTLTLKRDPAYWGNTLPVRVGTFNFERITYKLYSDGVARLAASLP